MIKRLFSVLLAGLLFLLQVAPVYATPLDDPTLSVTTFNNMPAFADGGTTFLDDRGLISQIGYNPSRSWSAGSLPKDVVLAGDLYNFGLGNRSAADLIGTNNFLLGQFSAINGESIESLSKAVPGLQSMAVDAVPAFKAIASAASGNYQQGVIGAINQYVPGAKDYLAANPWASQIPINSLIQGDWNGSLKGGISAGLGQLVKSYPNLKDVPFGDLAGNLVGGNWKGALNVGFQYGGKLLVKEFVNSFPGLSKVPLGKLLDTKNLSANSIPGLATTALGKLKIANKSIGSIPGLGNIPLKDVLNLGNLLRMGVANVDVIYGTADESPANYPISGSTKDDEFVPVPCVGKCPHFELANSKNIFGLNLNGRQWVTKVQKVPGGKGALGKMGGGKEPTGLTPWGPSVNMKLVVESVDEVKGVSLALYLRICVKTIFADLGCSPHIVGPIPIGTVKELGQVLIATSAAPPRINLPNGGSVDGVNCALPATPKKKLGYSAQSSANTADLVSVPTSMNRTETLHKDAAAAFNKMRSDAASQGIDLNVLSGHRSVAEQQQLWDAQVAKQGSEIKAAQLSAPPGYSEHHTGYALDIGTNNSSTNLEQSFKSTPAYGWLSKNAGKYGFTQSYTGAPGQGAGEEPWHWRYEGSAQAKEAFNPTVSPGSYNCSGNAGATDCTVYKGVHIGAFKDAIAKIESPGIGHSAVGPLLAPVKNDPHYQVAIGKYQFMTFRKEVIDEVTKNNGYGWLQSVWSGRKPTGEEVLKYFPVDAQERVMSSEVSTLLDQAQARGAGPSNLARTAAMIHNGGAGYSEGSSWTPGGLTVGEYGNQVLGDYNAALPAAQQKCKAAAAAGGANPNNPGGSTGSFANPVPGAPVTDEFDLGSNNWRGRPHKGIDIGGPMGAKVGAADGGRVEQVGYDAKGYGNFVLVDHGNGYATLYAHLDSVSVSKGQGVGKMDEIGKLGNTGGSTGPHLHLELIEGYKSGDIYSGYPVNPRTRFKF